MMFNEQRIGSLQLRTIMAGVHACSVLSASAHRFGGARASAQRPESFLPSPLLHL